jgi:alpha-glucoside transport system substrate-binding protein
MLGGVGWWRSAMLVMAVTVLVASCVSGGQAAKPDRLRGMPLEVVGAWSGTEQARFSLVLKAFGASTGVAVRYTSAHGQVPTTLDARLAAGDPPDVALLPQPGLLRRYASSGRLIPLDSETERVVEQHYAPVWRSLASQAGQDYGVWFKAANKSLVWYDIGTFERAGVVAPRNLDGLLQLARELHQQHIAAFGLGAADPWTLTDWFENLYLRVAGPARYDRLAAHQLRWTDPSVTATLRLMRQLLASDFLLGGVTGALRTGFEDSVAKAFARPAAAAMVAEGDFVDSVVAARTTAAVGVDIDLFPFPAKGPGEPSLVGGGDVAVQMTSSPAATALLRYLASPAAAAVWAAVGGFISPNLDLDLSVYPDPLTRSIARSLIEAGDGFRFDLSDLQPAEFGAQRGAGMQGELQGLLVTGDIDGTQRRLESAAAVAFEHQAG